MRLKNLDRYKNYNHSNDLANYFSVHQKTANYSLYNLNSTVYIDGKLDLSQCIVYTIKHGDTFEKISYAHYGTVSLAWLICKTNDITDMFYQLVPGQTLLILNAKVVTTIFNLIRANT